jgi:hypothetical protein
MNSIVLFTGNWGKDVGGMRTGCWIWTSVREYGSWCIVVMGNGTGRMYQVIVMMFGEGLGRVESVELLDVNLLALLVWLKVSIRSVKGWLVLKYREWFCAESCPLVPECN